ncbi:ATP-binding cassette domain-containing protein [Streptomyces sp. NPDC050617]|uniref:ATP-binding cassette domain-containing protein n=1 Tax=Streptomyces sp. NPDC050617 TaxID=3154628 RepID=UPI00341E50C9
MTTTYAVLSEGLHKRYGEVHALRGLDLAVPEGTVCGLLGPNGAGKTTAVHILSTLRAPSSGTARVAGHDVTADPRAVRRSIALTGQFASVDGDLTGRENLRLFARLQRLRPRAAALRADELLDRFGLAELAGRPARTYSGGQRRRLDLAACLLTDVPVLFLDEPTTGLDPRSRGDIWDAVRELAAGGTTVLLTTQYLEEADRLADDIVVIDHGRVSATGTPEELKAAIGSYVEVVVGDESELAGAAVALGRLTGAQPAVDPERRTVGSSCADPALTLPRVVRELDSAGIGLADVSVRRPTLDEVFLRLTADGGTDTTAKEDAA